MIAVALAAVIGVWWRAARPSMPEAEVLTGSIETSKRLKPVQALGERHGRSAPTGRDGRGHRLLRAGSKPGSLPGNVLIADKANNRLIQVDPHGRIVWRFPRPGDLKHGQTFRVPDDAFFSENGRRVIATQEDDYVISVIDVARHRIAYRYGTPGVPGAGPNHLWNPDDALLTAGGTITAADIKNCSLVVIRPPAHRVMRRMGTPGACGHNPPHSFGSPNGAFPTRDGGTVVTEITGDWVDVLDRHGKLVTAMHVPGFTYPSDTNEIRPGIYLSVDYVTPGAVETFDSKGRVRWRFAPKGSNALSKPSLALPLPNGDLLVNDDANHRVIVIDPRTKRIVWQYGHTGKPGRRAGYLNVPDGVDLAPPHALMRRFPKARPPHG